MASSMFDEPSALAGLPGFLPAAVEAPLDALGALGAFASLTGFSACLGLVGLALDALWVAAVDLALAFAALTGAGAVLEGAAAGGLAPALSLAMAD
jgi:hypothetical protein